MFVMVKQPLQKNIMMIMQNIVIRRVIGISKDVESVSIRFRNQAMIHGKNISMIMVF